MKEQKYCCFCGKKLILKTLYDGAREKYCDKCDHVFFPTPSPCVIVIVANKKKILLARGIKWKYPYWALISGHIKSGETAEKTAIREVREETGLNVCHLEFVGTYIKKDQNLLMIAFKAGTKNTFIKKSQELEDARWFDLSSLLPVRPGSIAAHIIKKVFPKTKLKNLKKLKKQKRSETF